MLQAGYPPRNCVKRGVLPKLALEIEMLYSLVLPIHSYLRWLIVLVGAVAIVRFAIGWLRAGGFKGMDRGLAAAFSGLIDLQALLGIVLLVGLGLSGEGFLRVRFEHGGFMLAAAILAHLPARWKKAPDAVRFRNALLCILGALLLIYFGVARLPIGWSM